jgi:hypothetical protein
MRSQRHKRFLLLFFKKEGFFFPLKTVLLRRAEWWQLPVHVHARGMVHGDQSAG